jgi:hypothetical protein
MTRLKSLCKVKEEKKFEATLKELEKILVTPYVTKTLIKVINK